MKKLTIIIAVFGLLAACSKQADDMALPQENNESNLSLDARIRHACQFKATLNASIDSGSTNPPTTCSGNVPFAAPDFRFSGTANHMGHLNAQLSKLHHDSCDLNTTTMLLTTKVSIDLVAANGDIIYCTGNDVVDASQLLTQTGTTGAITGTWTITGGTGRFNGSSGSIMINGLVDFITNTFTCRCRGTISY